MNFERSVWVLALCTLLASSCAPAPLPGPVEPVPVRAVDDARLLGAASEPESWLTYGGTYAEQRYSTLTRIDESNVSQLGLAWSYDLDTERGVEATSNPLHF